MQSCRLTKLLKKKKQQSHVITYNSNIIDINLSQTQNKIIDKNCQFNFQQVSYNTKKLIIKTHSSNPRQQKFPSCNQNSLLDLLLWPQLQYKNIIHDE
jgi:hypothetical protein